MNKNTLILTIFFITLLNITFNSSNVFFLIIPFIIIFLISICYSSKYLVLGSIIVYPFMFLIRNSNDSQILILLPEIVIFMSFIISFIFLNKNNIYVIEKKTFSLILLFVLLSSFINIFHIGTLEYYPIFIRIYLFPLLFFLTLASIIKRNNNILLEALHTSILSFGIVGVIALFNYFDLINIKNFQYLKIAARDTFFFLQMKRLDPLTSGAFGSAGAIMFTLGFILIFLKKEKFNKKINIFFSLVLLLGGTLSLSYSLIIPIISILAIFFLLKKKVKFLKYFNILFCFILFYFLLNANFFLQQNVVEYIMGSYLNSYLNFFLNLTFKEILFGSGMPINTLNYLYVPEKFISDVGIVRVFTETGIINFTVFFYLLLRLLKKLIEINPNCSSNYYNVLMVLLILFILLPHTNTTFLPPFYPLFIIVISSILHEHKLKFSNA
jgi:hypothetical protein